MSRPRQNSSQPTATQRMQNAFWDILKDTHYTKITVTDVVTRAKINRNSFYYHYDKLPDLATAAVKSTVDAIAKAMPELVEDPTESWRRIVNQLLGIPAHRIHIDHLSLVLSPNSDPFLLTLARDSIRAAFIKGQHLDENNMSLTSDVLLEFSTGGLIALVGMWPRLSQNITLDQLVTVDGAVLARTLYLSISNQNMPDFWIRLFRASMRSQDHSSLDALTQIETENNNFKAQVQALLDQVNAAANGTALPQSASHMQYGAIPSAYPHSDAYGNTEPYNGQQYGGSPVPGASPYGAQYPTMQPQGGAYTHDGMDQYGQYGGQGYGAPQYNAPADGRYYPPQQVPTFNPGQPAYGSQPYNPNQPLSGAPQPGGAPNIAGNASNGTAPGQQEQPDNRPQQTGDAPEHTSGNQH